MCGITGAVWTDQSEPISPQVLDRMTDVLEHRGPDDRGTYRDEYDDGSGVALGHRRLSIIDLAGGRQPISNEDGTIWVTFNGEIYNYPELRESLQAAGHTFRTDSDTETIVHLYEQEGDRFVDHLRGMFALAIWDGRRRRLVMARDRLGQKPLVYHHAEGRILFASEIKSLLQVASVPRRVDPIALDEYLTYLYVPQPRTMFQNIFKLPPAHMAIFEEGKLSLQRYWSPDPNYETGNSIETIREQLAHTLDEAVRLRLRSDVPLGAFLSGGIDSTMIVGLMQRNLDQPAKTYTIGFPVEEYDETSFARIAADHLQTEHHEFQVQSAAVNILPELCWHFDEPFADSSAIPTYYVSQVTSQHVKVALTGDGGDELFAGYPRYDTVHQLGKFDRLPSMVRGMVTSRIWDHVPVPDREASFAYRLKKRVDILRQPSSRRYYNWVATLHNGRRLGLYSDEFAQSVAASDPAGIVASAYAASGGRAPGTQAMHADLVTYLPGDLLAKVDITSMTHSLECRSPMLDHHVVELAMSVPYKLMMLGGGVKPLLTSALPGIMPTALLQREKMGFCVPLDHWFRNELTDFAREIVFGPRSLERGYFRPEALEKLFDEHASGRWNHGDRIWALICLEHWHRTFIDPVDSPEGPCNDLPDTELHGPLNQSGVTVSSESA